MLMNNCITFNIGTADRYLLGKFEAFKNKTKFDEKPKERKIGEIHVFIHKQGKDIACCIPAKLINELLVIT